MRKMAFDLIWLAVLATAPKLFLYGGIESIIVRMKTSLGLAGAAKLDSIHPHSDIFSGGR
jgi:hypothetical protein